MQEEFLHCIWKYKKFDLSRLRTTTGEELVLLNSGTQNVNSGPDFFNARVVVGSQEWAGNVEIHINSSDWYMHNHDSDPNYDNVVLHVVWNYNLDVYRKDGSAIPVLELRPYVPQDMLGKYRDLLNNHQKKWINCEKDFHAFDDFLLKNWLERLFFERLEEKVGFISQLLKTSQNDWEEVLFRMLARNFGLKVNGDAFYGMARSFPFSVLRKTSRNREHLEALFLGQAGLLTGKMNDPYHEQLKGEYTYMKKKFRLYQEGIPAVKFFRLRPDNFPGIRLAQLASLYFKRQDLFSAVIRAEGLGGFYELFRVAPSEYWQTHYSFGRAHPKRERLLTRDFVDLLVINTLLPLRYCFARSQGSEAEEGERMVQMLGLLKMETNSITKQFHLLRPGSCSNALESQGLLQLKQEYCDHNQCLNCSLGLNLLQRERQI